MLQLVANVAGAFLLVMGFFGCLSIKPLDRKLAGTLMVFSFLGMVVSNISDGKVAQLIQWLLVCLAALFLIPLFYYRLK